MPALYWHFLPADKKLRFSPRKLVIVGRTLRMKDEPALCHRGFHAAKRPLDALEYAPGPIICRVTLGGKILHGDDKCVAQERTVVWMADATRTLHEFACWCAKLALFNAKVEDARCWNAIEVKLRWLKGEATDAELEAAWSAARSAASSAAWSAAESAASSAARSAAESAAELAASSAAWSAAESAARSAQNRKLVSMLAPRKES